MGLEVANVDVVIGGVPILKGVSFSLSDTATLAFVGPNGAGKTTLLNAISGLVRVSGGHIMLNGRRISGWAAARRARAGIRRSFQAAQVLDRATVRANLEIAMGPDISRATDRVDQWLDRLSLLDVATACAGELSFGQRKLVSVAMAAVAPYKVLLLDEPVAGLSPPMAERMANVIRVLPGAKVIVEHNLDFLKSLGGQALLMVGGRVTRSGTLEEVLSSEDMRQAYS